jgi:hypothetical protein
MNVQSRRLTTPACVTLSAERDASALQKRKPPVGRLDFLESTCPSGFTGRE